MGRIPWRAIVFGYSSPRTCSCCVRPWSACCRRRATWRWWRQVADGARIVGAALECSPDVAIIDTGLPDVDGVDASAQLREKLPGCRVLIPHGTHRPGPTSQSAACAGRRVPAQGRAGFGSDRGGSVRRGRRAGDRLRSCGGDVGSAAEPADPAGDRGTAAVGNRRAAGRDRSTVATDVRSADGAATPVANSATSSKRPSGSGPALMCPFVRSPMPISPEPRRSGPVNVMGGTPSLTTRRRTRPYAEVIAIVQVRA